MNFTSTWKIADPLAQYIIYLRKSRKDMEAEALGQTDEDVAQLAAKAEIVFDFNRFFRRGERSAAQQHQQGEEQRRDSFHE